jgi:hypothetical protein
MTTGTTVVRGNNTVTNEIVMLAIMIFVVTSTTVTYVLALNKELRTVRPMKLVVAWSTIWSTVLRAPSNSPTTYDKSSVLEVLSLKSLTITMTRSIPSYGSNFLADLLWVTSTSWPITFPWWSARWGTNGLSENQFDSWYALRQAFVKNFIATYEQPGNKYDLQRIRDARDELLHEYIRRFSDMCIRIPRITDNEAIEAFITGLRYHNDLRDKLLRKRPITVVDLLTTAKKYADADDTKKLLNEGTGKAPYSS